MKTKIQQIISERLFLTNSEGIVQGEVFFQDTRLLLKQGENNILFNLNRPLVEVNSNDTTFEATIDVSQNDMFKLNILGAPPTPDQNLIINFIGHELLNYTISGLILVPLNFHSSFYYYIFAGIGVKKINGLSQLPIGNGTGAYDIISYFGDGQGNLFVSLSNTYF